MIEFYIATYITGCGVESHTGRVVCVRGQRTCGFGTKKVYTFKHAILCGFNVTAVNDLCRCKFHVGDFKTSWLQSTIGSNVVSGLLQTVSSSKNITRQCGCSPINGICNCSSNRHSTVASIITAVVFYQYTTSIGNGIGPGLHFKTNNGAVWSVAIEITVRRYV